MRISFCDKQHRSRAGSPARILGLFLGGVLFGGCSAKQESAAPPVAASRNKVVIKGSNTVGEELAPRLIAEFQKDHPKVEFDLESKGTGTGFSGLVAGVCDIGAASREIIDGEREVARAHGIQVKDDVIGSYSVAVIVN